MEISTLGVVLAVVAGLGVAFLWYQKGFIADAWETLTGVTPERSKPVRVRNMTQLLIAVIVTALGLALAIQITTEAVGDDSVWIALLVGFASWLAFSGSTLLQHNAFEMKRAKLTAINSGYQLVLFLVMSLVLGLL